MITLVQKVIEFGGKLKTTTIARYNRLELIVIKKIPLFIFLLPFFSPLPSSAGEIGGVTLPDSLKVGETTLALNGMGLRKKLFIKVYAGGLYLEDKAADAAAIIEADATMAVRMHFIYDGVSSSKLIEAWNEGFKKNTQDRESIQDQIDTFNGFFGQEANQGDVYDLIYTKGAGLEVLLNGESKGTVGDLNFKRAVFAIWLGKVPADEKLKKGMLGK